MSTLSLLRRLSRSRPAPPGVERTSTRLDEPPDGWASVDPTPAQSVAATLDGTALRIADAAAAAVSRRQFIKRIGQIGLIAGLAASGLLWRPASASGYAETFGYCDPFGDPPTGPCGPSGLCNPDRCTNGNCTVDNKRRPYGGNTCCSTCTGTSNCWREKCCGNPSWVSYVKCCDCCAPGGTNGNCMGTNCTNTKCNCRAAVSSPTC